MNKTHGLSDTSIYQRWQSMVGRCKYKSHTSWKWYGAVGITVARRWLSFENFIADMGYPPFPGATIERIDSHGPYSPKNCRWATASEQGRNRRNTRYLTFSGQTHSAWEWSEQLGIPAEVINDRKRRGWSDERALSQSMEYETMLYWSGKRLPLRQWAKAIGLKASTLWYRLNVGWSVEQALTTPLMTSSQAGAKGGAALQFKLKAHHG